MKLRVLLVIFISLMINPGFLYSQENSVKFSLNHDGTMLTEDGKNFKVIQYDGESKESIYNKLLLGITSLFNDPKTVISKLENQMISLSGIQGINWNVKGLLGTIRVDFHYVIKFHIKDNRVKVDSPYFTMLSFSSGGSQRDISGWLVAQKIFTKEGQPNTKKENNYQFYNDINNTFNTLVSQILNYTTTQEDW